MVQGAGPVVVAGKYTLAERLDAGGVFATYRATDLGGRTVVVKLLRGADPAVIAGVGRAAESGVLVHPDLLRPLDWGMDGPDGYIVREYVTGTDLGAVAKATGGLPPAQVAGYGAQVASALAALHAQSLVLGNLKSANILLPTGSAQVKVVGLGAVLARGSQAPPVDAPASAAHYLSPEQLQGREPTPASDIYALGVVLYELATGRVPFDGASAGEVGQKHLSLAPLPPNQLKPGLPASLNSAILRMLAKDPALRYGSAEEARQALGWVTAAPAAAPAPVAQKRKAWPLLLLAVVVVGLIAVVVAAAIGNNSVDVPDLAGKTLVQAEQELAAVELTMGAVTYQPDVPEGTKSGTVVAQSPAAAERMRRHGTVDVTLAGQPEATVPDVVGKEEAQAASALQAAGLQVGDVERTTSDSVAMGLVIGQVPKAGTQVPKSSVVVLTVSSGPAQPTTGTVPNVEGVSQKDATNTLKAAGFATVAQQAYSDTVDAGLVSKQSPPAGSKYEQGGEVTITVSAGKLPFAPVPDVTGKTEAEATQALDTSGFKSSTTKGFSDTAPVGQVLSQAPPAGVYAKTGLAVVLVLSQGPAPSQAVTVPDVGGKTQDEATATLEGAGFKVAVLQVYSDTVPAGNVVGQAPAASGTTVQGATVTIAVSQGPMPTGPPAQ